MTQLTDGSSDVDGVALGEGVTELVRVLLPVTEAVNGIDATFDWDSEADGGGVDVTDSEGDAVTELDSVIVIDTEAERVSLAVDDAVWDKLILNVPLAVMDGVDNSEDAADVVIDDVSDGVAESVADGVGVTVQDIVNESVFDSVADAVAVTVKDAVSDIVRVAVGVPVREAPIEGVTEGVNEDDSVVVIVTESVAESDADVDPEDEALGEREELTDAVYVDVLVLEGECVLDGVHVDVADSDEEEVRVADTDVVADCVFVTDVDGLGV